MSNINRDQQVQMGQIVEQLRDIAGSQLLDIAALRAANLLLVADNEAAEATIAELRAKLADCPGESANPVTYVEAPPEPPMVQGDNGDVHHHDHVH